MRIWWVSSVLLLCVLSTARLGGAVDKPTFQCEDKSYGAGTKWGGARGACIVKCQQAFWKENTGSTLGKCSTTTSKRCCGDADCPSGETCSTHSVSRCCFDDDDPATHVAFDAVTAGCIQKNDTKYISAVVKACPAEAFPTCAPYSGDGACAGDANKFCATDQDCVDQGTAGPCGTPNATNHALSTIALQAHLVDGTTVPIFMCDDGTAAKCETTTVKTLAKLAISLGKCLSKCEKNVFGGKSCGTVTCQCKPNCSPPPTGPFGTLDATTKACVDAVVAKSKDKIVKGCLEYPACGPYSGKCANNTSMACLSDAQCGANGPCDHSATADALASFVAIQLGYPAADPPCPGKDPGNAYCAM